MDPASLPPQPLQVLASPPRKLDTLTGTCSVPVPAGGWGPAPSGVQVWLANLLYSEQMAWPFSVFVDSRDPRVVNDAVLNTRNFSFSIPLFSHLEFPTTFLYGGTTKLTSHSWSSQGAGLWTVLCSSWKIDETTGELRACE